MINRDGRQLLNRMRSTIYSTATRTISSTTIEETSPFPVQRRGALLAGTLRQGE